MKEMKKFINITVLVALLCGTIFSISIFDFKNPQKAKAEGTGIEADPYQITSWAELASMNSHLGSLYILMNDLSSATTGYATYASSSANSGLGWNPIGKANSSAVWFTGSFDGKGHTISDLYINRPTESYVGLFGHLHNTSTVVKNVGILNVNITGQDLVGPIADSYQGTITNTYTTGTVSGRDYVGGLNGENDYVISNSYSSASVSGRNYVGGLIGVCFLSTTSNSYATGSVTSTANNQNRGGLTGYNYQGHIINSYSIGAVNYPNVGSNGGGFVGGKATGGSYEDTGNFWDNQTSGWSTSAMGTGKTTVEMKNVRTFTDTTWSSGLTSPWDFVNNPYNDTSNVDIWRIVPTINNGYPINDNVAPTVLVVNTAKSDGYYKSGETIDVTVQYSEAVTVVTTGGVPTLDLNSGGSAIYNSGSTTNTLTFRYTVGAGQNSTDLDYPAINSLGLNGGTIQDAATNSAVNTLPSVGTFATAHAIVIDTTAPTPVPKLPNTGVAPNEKSIPWSIVIVSASIIVFTSLIIIRKKRTI